MRLGGALACLLVLAGCQRSSQDEVLLRSLPAEIGVPKCEVLRVDDSGGYETKDGYRDVLFVTMLPHCLDEWSGYLTSRFPSPGCTDNCPLAFHDGIEGEWMVVLRSKSSVAIAWTHKTALRSVTYRKSVG